MTAWCEALGATYLLPRFTLSPIRERPEFTEHVWWLRRIQHALLEQDADYAFRRIGVRGCAEPAVMAFPYNGSLTIHRPLLRLKALTPLREGPTALDLFLPSANSQAVVQGLK